MRRHDRIVVVIALARLPALDSASGWTFALGARKIRRRRRWARRGPRTNATTASKTRPRVKSVLNAGGRGGAHRTAGGPYSHCCDRRGGGIRLPRPTGGVVARDPILRGLLCRGGEGNVRTRGGRPSRLAVCARRPRGRPRRDLSNDIDRSPGSFRCTRRLFATALHF